MCSHYLDGLYLPSAARRRSFEEFKRTTIKNEPEDPNMPKDADWQSADHKENVNPLAIGPGTDENLKYDRAHDVVRRTVQDASGVFDYDRTLEAESPSNNEPVLARSTPTRTASPLDPGSPSLSDADGRVDEETESEASGENDGIIEVKSTTKRHSPRKGGSKKRKADTTDSGVMNSGRAGLRTRTPAQQTPFKAEKLAYSMTRAQGRNVSRDEVEKQLKQERKIPRTKAKAKAKATSNKPIRNQQVESEESSGEESVSASNHISSERVNDEYKLQHTTLRITVAESAGGGIEVSLARSVSTSAEGVRRCNPQLDPGLPGTNFANTPRPL